MLTLTYSSTLDSLFFSSCLLVWRSPFTSSAGQHNNKNNNYHSAAQTFHKPSSAKPPPFHSERLNPPPPPFPCHHASSSLFPSYIFGGYSPTGGHLSDLHKLTLTGDDFTWSEISIARTAFGGGGTGSSTPLHPPRPSPRRHAAAAVTWLSDAGSPGSVSAIIVGGINAPTATSGSSQGGGNETARSAVVFGDVWQLEFLGPRVAWRELEVSGGDAGGGLPR